MLFRSVAAPEMFRTFNMGVGLALIVSADDAASVASELTAEGEKVFFLGQLEAGKRRTIIEGVTDV